MESFSHRPICSLKAQRTFSAGYERLRDSLLGGQLRTYVACGSLVERTCPILIINAMESRSVNAKAQAAMLCSGVFSFQLSLGR